MPSVRTPREIRNERSAPGHDGQHHVVDGPAEGVLDELEVLERAADADEAPVRADVDVQRRLRRGVQTGPDDLADALRRLARAGERVIGVRERVERALRERDPGAHGAEQAGGQQLGDAGLGVRLPRAPGVAQRRRVGREVEQHRRQVDPGDAVDQRVVAL